MSWSSREMREFYACARTVARRILLGQEQHSWTPSVLVNEAFTRILSGAWADRLRDNPKAVLPALRTIMRRTYYDHLDRKAAGKRPSGGARVKQHFDDGMSLLEWSPESFFHALEQLEVLRTGRSDIRVREPEKFGEAVELAFFVGLTTREIADELSISQRTAANWVLLGTAWLNEALNGGDNGAA